MTVKTDRRTQNRKRPLTLVYVELPPSNGGMMRDLSEQGFSLRAMIPLKPSEKVPFSFSLDTTARIDGEAIVLRLEENGHVVALQFAGLPSHARDQIRRWLEKFEEPLNREAVPARPPATETSTLKELRSEIYSSPSRPVGPPADKKNSPPAPPPAHAAPTPPPAEPSRSLSPPQPAASPDLVSSPISAASLPVQAPPIAPVQSLLPAPAPSRSTPPAPPLQSSAASLLPAPPTAPPELPQALPPLLKLSSVRPGPPPLELPVEVPMEAFVPVVTPQAVAIPSAEIPQSSPKVLSPSPEFEKVPAIAAAAPTQASRLIPPPLEPLSSFEGDTDAASPGWMDRFTLGRAISIMLFLTLLAGSSVYHRELGRALIWLGQQIEGVDSPEISHTLQPPVPLAEPAIPDTTPTVSSAKPSTSASLPDASASAPPASSEPKSVELPRASENTPAPQLKDATPGSLIVSSQVNRLSSTTPSVANTSEAGQPEYQQAMQILRSSSSEARLPEAVRLLWVAVQNGNVGAEIALAELYRQGRGVTRNCDQARILLSAAARKGSADAQKRLHDFQLEGCAE